MPTFRLFLILLIVIVVGYGFNEAFPLLSGPKIKLSSPVNGMTTTSDIVTIAGTAKRVVALSFDGEPILPNRTGTFSKTLALPRGGAILTLTAMDRFGRTVTKKRTIFVQ
ncbi:MAG TPA: hypothetical protein ENJ75_02710 [Candidatus Kaiserbacteria bacterium]|nr:hypothetical protein [Candidatus Kaiserbacteria bacterium]